MFFCTLKNKNKQKFRRFKKNKFSGILKFLQIIHTPSLGKREVPQKNLGPIGSAVLTFIGYKQTDKQTDRQTSQIYI